MSKSSTASILGSVRKATLEDREAMLWISLASMPKDPGHFYIYPRDDHSKEPSEGEKSSIGKMITVHLTNKKYEVYVFQTAEDAKVVGYIVFKLPKTEPSKQKFPASLGMWQNMVENHGFSDWERLGARWKLIFEQVEEHKDIWFTKKYGHNQLWLESLFVHPGYQRRGVATALIAECRNAAHQRQLPITFMATINAVRWYEKRGFRVVDRFVTQVEGEDESVVNTGMEMPIDTSNQ